MSELAQVLAIDAKNSAKACGVPKASAYESVPNARGGFSRGVLGHCEVIVLLKIVTSVLGSAASKRAVDEFDVLRAATAHLDLSLWWRALRAARYSSAKQLCPR